MDPPNPIEPLDAVKNAFSEAKNSKFTRRTSSYTRSTNFRIPLIQEGQCIFNVVEGNESWEPIPDRLWPISKIPSHVREVDENAFTPRLVSIGPIHYKKSGLEFMESQKTRFLDRLLERCKHFLLIDALETSIKELEADTREFYAEDFSHMDSDSFTRMMLLDGCFVIELLRLGGRSCQGKLADDPIFGTRWMPLSLGLDLLLLENQLPLFLLDRLFNLTRSDIDYDSLVSLALQFFTTLSPGKDVAVTTGSHDTDYLPPHILALFHNSFTPKGNFQSPAQEGRPCRRIVYSGKGWIHTAKILNLSGIKFKQKAGNILDIEFNNRELMIPQVLIDHRRSTILRNLVAYEQQDRRIMPYFTSLMVFFSNILCTTDDARILMQSGIIRQAENDEEEIVKFFNSVVKELVFDMNRCYLHKLIEDVNCTSQSVWAKLRSTFRPIIRRFSILEVAVLIISLVQTVLVVQNYFHPV